MDGFWIQLSEPYRFNMDAKYLIPTALRKARREAFEKFKQSQAETEKDKTKGFFTGRSIEAVPIGVAGRGVEYRVEVPPVTRRYLKDNESIYEPHVGRLKWVYRFTMALVFGVAVWAFIWEVVHAA